MQKFFVGLLSTMVVGSAFAATARSTARMPSMPTMTINPGTGIGNSGGGNSGNNGGGGIVNPPVTPPVTPPASDCPDGGVVNSEYTSENCMNDVLNCINQGALPGGLNDLFDPVARHQIFGNMNLCNEHGRRSPLRLASFLAFRIHQQYPCC